MPAATSLPPVTSITGAEIIALEQSSTGKRTTAAELAEYIASEIDLSADPVEDQVVAYDAASSIAGSDLLPLVQTTTGKKATVTQLREFAAYPVGLFSALSGASIPVVVERVRSKGYHTLGKGVSDYVYDSSLTGTYVSSNPRLAFQDAAGRVFKLVAGADMHVDQTGAYGDGSTDDTAAITALWGHAPNGATIHYGPNRLKVTSTLTCSKYFHHDGKGARIEGHFGADTSSDLFVISVTATSFTDTRQASVRDFIGIYFANGGHTALKIATGGSNVANILWDVSNNFIGTLDTSTGYALHFDGAGTHFNRCFGNNIENGIYLTCYDSTWIHYNLIQGVRVGVTINLVKGSFRTSVKHNGIVSRDGAVKFVLGSEVQTMFNQIEQYSGYGDNTSTPSASIFCVASTSEPNRCHNNVIWWNNFGGGAYVDRNIYLVTGADAFDIDHNVLNHCDTYNATLGVFEDIKVDSGCEYNVIGENNRIRGWRGGVYSDPDTGLIHTWPYGSADPRPGSTVSEGAFDPADYLGVIDSGTGTYGVWKDLTLTSPAAVSSGYFARHKKMRGDMLQLELGFYNSGGSSISAGTTLATLPEGARPRVHAPCQAYNSSVGGTQFLIINDAGQIINETAISASNHLRFSGVFPVKGRTKFKPGV